LILVIHLNLCVYITMPMTSSRGSNSSIDSVAISLYPRLPTCDFGFHLQIMASARNLLPAIRKVAIGNYTLSGLVGVEVSGKTYGVVGTGNIGIELIKLLQGFSGRVLAYDIYQNEEAKKAGAEYVSLETLLQESDVVSLHTPLLPSTRHIMNRERLRMMKQDAMLINVSRGALIDSEALVEVLYTGHLSSVALDVYEFEEQASIDANVPKGGHIFCL
jgi:D-lactate dehydrogenase